MNRTLEPLRPDRFDASLAAHLLRRAGFVPSAEQVQAAVEAGLERTIETLIDPPDESGRARELDQPGDAIAVREDIERLRQWWLMRMVHTQRPLHARLAVFWHNHFATSYVKVRKTALMYRQLRTIERHALGPFEELLAAMSRDPAMILWLDNQLNEKGRPNENYARELFELFSLGPGHYSEHDIREAARAFTGYQQRDGRFHFNRLAHDDGVKTVHGRTGRFDGDDVVRIACAQPACSRFLSRKLLRELLCPEPPDGLVEAFAAVLRAEKLHIGRSLRVLLGSEAFFDPRWRWARIKSPVEFVVGLARSLHLRVGGPALSEAVVRMDQRLFEPPSVKGWDGHRAWLNSATMLVRLRVAAEAVESDAFDPPSFCERYGLTRPEDAVRFCLRLTLGDRVPPAVQQAAINTPADTAEAAVRTLRLAVTQPEYQLA